MSRKGGTIQCFSGRHDMPIVVNKDKTECMTVSVTWEKAKDWGILVMANGEPTGDDHGFFVYRVVFHMDSGNKHERILGYDLQWDENGNFYTSGANETAAHPMDLEEIRNTFLGLMTQFDGYSKRQEMDGDSFS